MTKAAEIKLSQDQREALDRVLDFWQKEGDVLTVGGLAGTGKTTLIKEATNALRGRSRRKWRHKDAVMAFCAYTGKAAEVLRRKLESAGALEHGDYCGTIHGLIYEPVTDSRGRLLYWKRREQLDYDLIVADEASMVTSEIHGDLKSYGVPILYVGDHGQLPPINGALNLMADPDVRLEKIHRQAEGNPIIRLSMLAREEGRIPVGEHGPGVMKLSDPSVVGRIADPDKALILCGWNKFRCDMNQRIRGISGIVGRSPVPGERVICLRNNREEQIYNGMTGTLVSIEPHTEDAYAAEIKMDGTGTFTGLVSTHQFGEDKTLLKAPGWTRQQPVELFDWGYCLTVHKAQGSEHDRVVLFEQRSSMMDDDTWRRWLYTGITRAKRNLLVVGF